MSRRRLPALVRHLCVAAGLLLAPGGAAAADDPGALEDLLRAERTRLDSLNAQRRERVAEVDRLAALVDSLKRTALPSLRARGALEDALRRSLAAVTRVEETDAARRAAEGDLRRLVDRARRAYDEAVGALIDALGADPDAAALARLKALRLARARLAETAPADLDPGAEPLIIRDTDSPREIRQKAQLLEDVADQLEARSQALRQEVARLETERRLRARASAFARDLDLFGETLPEGRSVSPSATSSIRPPTESTISGPAAAALAAEREVAQAGDPVAFDDGLESEIARLRADRARLEERLGGLKASADSFRVRAARLLEAAH